MPKIIFAYLGHDIRSRFLFRKGQTSVSAAGTGMTIAEKAAAPSVLYFDQAVEIGGAELYLIDVLTHIDSLPATVCVIEEGPFSALLQAREIPVTVLGSNRLQAVRRENGLGDILRSVPGTLAALGDFARIARRHDVVYANTMKAFIIAALARPLYRRPLIWNLHDLLTAEHFSAPLRLASTRLASLMASLVIANSRATAESYRQAGGRGRVEVVHNGIVAAHFDAIDPQGLREALAAETGLDVTRPIVGVFSRLAAWKGQHVLIEAIARTPDMQAVIVGGALFGEAAYETALHEQIQALGLGSRVRLLGFRTDIPRLMKSVDIIAHTSIAPEPFGRVVVEGMLAGRPVIATRAGGVPEILSDGRTGLLVPPGDVAELAAALQRLCNPVLARTLSAEASRVAREDFSVSGCADRIAALIRSVAGGKD